MGSARGIGASLPRKEDHRLLHGRGEFVADIAMPGTMDVAFVRSPLAHARIRGATRPAGSEEQVYTAVDLAQVRPIVARSGLPGFKTSEQPVLATERVRYAGEPIVACVGKRGPRRKISRAAWRSTSRSCPRSLTCSVRVTPTPRCCTRAGATT